MKHLLSKVVRNRVDRCSSNEAGHLRRTSIATQRQQLRLLCACIHKFIHAPQRCLLVQAALQQQKSEVALCLLRVIFTTSLASPTPTLSALTEDVILGLLLRQPSSQPGLTRGGLTRQGSYTEAQLGAPAPQEEVRPAQCACSPCPGACLAVKQTQLGQRILDIDQAGQLQQAQLGGTRGAWCRVETRAPTPLGKARLTDSCV